ncbi:MAG: hypothetical protein GVY11_02345 [Gammaproteobacteria bacterium]|jgi:CRISPR/Cas system CSM-associated protein Csm3 (group 7 of RAMP superfamily)|nr:hypothetical protein [Gammaproteobacteria bacterium]
MSNADTGSRYPRISMELRLRVNSPLHVGNGFVEPIRDRIPEEREELLKKFDGKRSDATFRPMTSREAGHVDQASSSSVMRACIPGSTIKGALRGMIESELKNDYAAELFGQGRENADHSAERRSGRIRFRDSARLTSPEFGKRLPPLWSPGRGTGVRARLGIDPATATAEKHALTFYEFVPEGSLFEFRFEGVDVSRAAVNAFCHALAGLKCIRLGAGGALCAGELVWADGNALVVRASTPAHIAKWCAGSEPDGQPEAEKIWPPEMEPASADTGSTHTDDFSVELTVVAEDPLLVASGLDRAEKEAESEIKTDEHADQMQVMQTADDRIRIPASSMRGILRARARKILALWVRELRPQGDLCDPVERLLAHLFGDTTRASPLQVSEFLSKESVQIDDLHHQFFNAIDRFTGGVASGHLYEVRAAPPGTRFCGRLALRPGASLAPWARLLLALLVRDLQRGDLSVGWGRAKGYGTIRLLHDDSALSPSPASALPKAMRWSETVEGGFAEWLENQIGFAAEVSLDSKTATEES